MNTFNISFLWMEMSILGIPFYFAHHLVELGSYLDWENIKEIQPAAGAERQDKKNGMPGHIKTVIIYNYTTHNPFFVSHPTILAIADQELM